jgi:hypothetical protein
MSYQPSAISHLKGTLNLLAVGLQPTYQTSEHPFHFNHSCFELGMGWPLDISEISGEL